MAMGPVEDVVVVQRHDKPPLNRQSNLNRRCPSTADHLVAVVVALLHADKQMDTSSSHRARTRLSMLPRACVDAEELKTSCRVAEAVLRVIAVASLSLT